MPPPPAARRPPPPRGLRRSAVAAALCLAAFLWAAAEAAAESPPPPGGGPEASRATVPAPPFRHAMVFCGGSLDIHALFGMYDAAVASGNAPDLVIGTCGGALAAAIIKAMPDPAERRAFIDSRTFYGYMRALRYTDLSLLQVFSDLREIGHLAVEQPDPASPHRVVPDPFFPRTIMHPDNRYHYAEIDLPFACGNPSAPEVVMLSNRMLFGEEHVGRRPPPGRKLYRETVYCSPRVARMLREMGLRSGVGRAFPHSFVAEQVDFVTGERLWRAARNSYSDPYLLPVDEPYLTGAVSELTAYEITRLAAEASIRYPPQWDRIDGSIMRKFFAYDPWEATEIFVSLPADRWLDTTDPRYTSLARQIGFAPTPQALATLGIRVKTNIPKFSHRRFLRLVERQYRYGWESYLASDCAPPNCRGHIDDRYDRLLPPEELNRARERGRRQWSRD